MKENIDSNYLSKCCNAPIYVADGGGDFFQGDPHDIRTCWYECMQCKKQCDFVSKTTGREVFHVPEVGFSGGVTGVSVQARKEMNEWNERHHQELLKKKESVTSWVDLRFLNRVHMDVIQECYNECLAVECEEGECARAIATKFPFISRYPSLDE